MVYATSLAAELRKRRMQLELKMPADARPRPKVNWNQSVSSGASAEDAVIIIDDLSSPEDEVNPDNDTYMKENDAGDNKQMSLEPDAKKQKMELSDVGAVDQQSLPAPIVDDTLLSSIPMPTQFPSEPAVTLEVKCSPVVAEEKLSPMPSLPTLSKEQHSTPPDEQKTSPASIDQSDSIDQRVSSSDTSYAFKRLTELPMPPAATDDECESPSENNR